jgi:predicted alpha/beta superfamily hydrolase
MSGFLFAQDTEKDITIGKDIWIKSEILNEKRQLFISLPNRYDQTNTRYPVLYLLDGASHFLHATSATDFLARNGLMPQMIVVAIVNIDRTRDFTPTHIANRPTSGEAKKFLTFMHDELFPYIESKYRTQPYRILFGHSLGGMFGIYTLFTQPDLYNAVIAVSPFLMYDSQYVLHKTNEELKKPYNFKRFLYITLGNEPTYTATLEQFKQLLNDRKPGGLIWDYKDMQEDNHNSVPLKSLYSGLEKLYQGFYDSLGEGYEANNQVELAKENYLIAVKKGQLFDDPNLNIYQDHLKQAEAKLAERTKP